MKIAVIGASGHMGKVLREEIGNSNHQFLFGIDKDSNEDEIYSPSELENLLNERNVDVVIDFSVPEAAVEAAEKCASQRIPYVTGTSGLSEQQLEKLRELGESSVVLRASNFAPGIQALRNAVVEAINSVPGYDVEVTETHHNRKEDAPSGTARTIIRDIKEELGEMEEQRGREGMEPREDNEIGVHARRAGDIKGEHEVMLAGNDEVLQIRHRSESRDVFAAGAIKAAEWAKNREEGFYSFEDIL